MTVCDNCKGKGKVNGGDCEVCYGFGVLEEELLENEEKIKKSNEKFIY